MVRPLSLCAALGAALLLIVPFFAIAAPDDEARSKEIETSLALKRALDRGNDQLQRGNYQDAVYELEREAGRVGPPALQKEYLHLLEEAYRGYIRELQKAHRDDEAVKYTNRLALLDPGSRMERNPAPPALAKLAASTAPPVKPPETSVRGAMDYKAPGVIENDPFNDVNLDVRSLLTHADREFKDNHFQAAALLYQKANTIDPNATAACRECWAYCKLAGVVEALKQPDVPPTAVPTLQREVRLAMEMTPKLDDLGKKLLRNLEERTAPGKGGVTEASEEVDVKFQHLPKQGQWCVLETANFRILHNQSPEFAEKVAKIVERTRLAMSKKWFGDNGGVWNPRCDVYLYATAQDYSRDTSVPANSPGHSTIRAEGERVLSRRIDVHCDDSNMTIGVLPHETTHVVLAGHYNGHAVPRWADEGMAVLAEPRDRIERHLHNLPRHRDEHTLFGVGDLMQLKDYPQPQYIGSFYAQSVSLVEYLSSLKGSQEFTAFLRDGLRSGYEPALQKHFGIQGYADLDRRWRTSAFSQQSAASYP